MADDASKPALDDDIDDIDIDYDIHKPARRLYLRTGASIVAFMVFLGFVVNAWLIDGSGRIPFASVVPLVIAVFILPRHARSGVLIMPERDPEVAAQHRALRLRLDRLGRLATILRVAYFAIAAFAFFALPKLLPVAS